uniref:Uncharacterized protein n=1 Tax=Solanum tuberosum TaxID=4113 RepID=M1DJN7_SOLTU
MPLLDTDEVLPMDPLFHPLLIRQASTSGSMRRKTNIASSSQAAAEVDGERMKDDAGDGTLPTQSQPPLSGARVEEDLAAVQRRLGSSYASTTSVPPSTALEVDMLHRQLRHERRKSIERDHLMPECGRPLRSSSIVLTPRGRFLDSSRETIRSSLG